MSLLDQILRERRPTCFTNSQEFIFHGDYRRIEVKRFSKAEVTQENWTLVSIKTASLDEHLRVKKIEYSKDIFLDHSIDIEFLGDKSSIKSIVMIDSNDKITKKISLFYFDSMLSEILIEDLKCIEASERVVLKYNISGQFFLEERFKLNQDYPFSIFEVKYYDESYLEIKIENNLHKINSFIKVFEKERMYQEIIGGKISRKVYFNEKMQEILAEKNNALNEVFYVNSFYDVDGRINRLYETNSFGEVEFDYVYSYKFDDQKNWIERHGFMYDKLEDKFHLKEKIIRDLMFD